MHMKVDARGSLVSQGSWLCATIAAALVGSLACEPRMPLPPAAPAAPAPAVAAAGFSQRLFFDDFDDGQLRQWEPTEGQWQAMEPDARTRGYGSLQRQYALTVAGAPRWTDYRVQARITLTDDRRGPVGVAGRVQGSHYFYELVLGRGDSGIKSWFIRRRANHSWTTLATGPFDYQTGVPQVLRFDLMGSRFRASASRDGGASFVDLGAADAETTGDWRNGRVGLVTYGGLASFDDVAVTGGDFLAAQSGPWSPIVLLRDDTTRFPSGKPAGGWYVAPIHVTLRPSDGKVIVNGWGRKAPADCTSSTNSQNSTSWILDPNNDLNGSDLMVQPMVESPVDPVTDVLYCSGHSLLPGGRILYVAGSRYPGGFPHSMGELGLNYSQIFDPANNSFTRISTAMKGGPTGFRGQKWYPTATRMADGQVLIFGGFSWSSSGSGDRMNQSLELFDPVAWDANHGNDPWTVLTQHEEGQAETTPTRGYTNVFVLPKAVPAGSGGGLARSVALMAGAGKVFLFNHEPGPTGAQRLLARPNAVMPNPSGTEKGEGASGVVLTDGTIMFSNGGHDGIGAQRAYFYDPFADGWTSLDLGVSRIYGDALALPDGTVLVMNGYVSEPGNINDVVNPVGDVRSPSLIDPYASPRTATTLPPWPEPTGRGYHSVSLLLKDGRVLVGGGKDGNHATACEKNEMRIFEPPYLSAGPRPVIGSPAEGSTLTVAGAPITVNYSGANLRATRGVVLMAPGSLTHGFDMGQRYVPLSYTSAGPGSLTVTPPDTINIAPPGDYLMFLISDLGVPSLGSYIRLAAPPVCNYAIDGAGHSYLEAEARSRQGGAFVALGDPGRSGGLFVQAGGTQSHTTVPDEGDVLWYDVNVSNGGGFFLWLLAQGAAGGPSSVWASVDGNPDVVIDLPVQPADWGWVKATNPVTLGSGRHMLKIKLRTVGAQIDKILLTQVAGFTPQGLGGSALLCNGPAAPPVPPPAPTGLSATPGNGQVTLSWTAAPGATSYTVKRAATSGGSYAVVQSGIPGTSFTNQGLSNGVTYFFVVSASNAGGEGPDSGEVPGTPAAALWSEQDIGGNGLAGSSTQNGGTFTIKGSGSDIYGSTDNFHFVYRSITGDATITARINSVSNANVWSKAGVMMRESTAAGARNVFSLVSATMSNLYRYQTRTLANMSSNSAPGGNGAVPIYLRVTRMGNTFSGSFSSNNTTWTALGSPTTIALPGTILMGMAVTSHTTTSLATAVFDTVSITTPNPQPPAAPTGLACSPGNGQCALTWSAVSGATSYNVKRSTTSGSGYTTIVSGLTSPNHLDTTVSNGTTYFYVVSASNAVGEGPNSGEQSCTPVASQPAPAAPTNLVATVANGTTATLTWADNSNNETGFRVERKVGAGSFTTLASKAANATSHVDSTLTVNNTYSYRVIATGSADSAPSNEVVVIIGNPTADAYVRSGTSAGSNFGTAATLEVKSTATTTTMRNTFLRFSLTGVAATVTSAKLRLNGSAVTSAKATNVHAVSDNAWTETGITWNYPTSNAGGPAMTTPALASQTVAITAGFTEWDITAYVQQLRTQGASTINLGVKSGVMSDEGQTSFSSKEGTTAANRPVLVISSRP